MGFLDRFRTSRSATPHGTGPGWPAGAQTNAPLGTRKPRFAVIDVETTGLSPQGDRVVEIAVVTTDPWGRVLDEWATRINPEGPVGASHIHGITEADVANAPVFREIVEVLNTRLAGAAIAAHHARFDLAFLRAEYGRAGWDLPYVPALCTLQASDYHLPSLDRRRLADCCWAVGVTLNDAHSALGDARATAQLLTAFMHPHVGIPPLEEHVDLPAQGLAVRWPDGPVRPPSLNPPTGARGPLPARVQIKIAAAAQTEPAPTLVELVEQFSLIDALDEGAPTGALAYLEKLAEVLEDGEVSSEEADDLASVADAAELTNDDIAAANLAFVRALAHAALEDGRVSRAERAELQHVSDMLGVNPKAVPVLLDQAEGARNARMSADLKPLPEAWEHGEPLRVGDKVVFTGCDATIRTHLEAHSESLGVRIVGNVSAKTAMLVADGTFDGTKWAKARELSTRTVHPDSYRVLLDHLQPAITRTARPLPNTRPAPAPAARHLATDEMPVSGSSETDATKPPAAQVPPAVPSGPNPAVVRAWARANGLEVGTRGRIHADIFAAYDQANRAE